jgi:hypothetical protein
MMALRATRCASASAPCTVLTGRAEVSGELSQYNACGVATTVTFLCGVEGAALSALFGFMAAVENDEAVSGNERA